MADVLFNAKDALTLLLGARRAGDVITFNDDGFTVSTPGGGVIASADAPSRAVAMMKRAFEHACGLLDRNMN